MISIRCSPDRQKNNLLRHIDAKPRETNVAWLRRVGATRGIILIGGSGLADFRLRVAQSHVRSDLLPSFWSIAGLLHNNSITTVPLDAGDASQVPSTNAVQTLPVRTYDDPKLYPNVAVLRFVEEDLKASIDRVKRGRDIVDLPALLVTWLGYVWGVANTGNPLLAGQGLPSAVLVESVYNMAGIELTPGLASSASNPEAIWQSAKWWQRYYRETLSTTGRAGVVPGGTYVIRQEAAAVVEP